MRKYVLTLLGGGLLIAVGLPLYALPATRSLPRGRRPGLAPMSLAEAAARVGRAHAPGPAQVEAARALVGERMAYCRRNSFDPYSRAFARGYGYCQQTALALADLLRRLGYSARVVHCLRCRFPDGRVTSHAWVRVRVDGEERDLDPLFWDEARKDIAFAPQAGVMNFTWWWRLLGGWGSPAVNAHRYYQTGEDP